MTDNCDCKRIKRTFPHGRNAAPVKYCKDCGKVLKPMDIKKANKFKRRPKREREEYPGDYMEEKI